MHTKIYNCKIVRCKKSVHLARHRREVKHDGRILRIYASKITARQKRRELVLKIAPIGGLKFGARREMSYLCRCI